MYSHIGNVLLLSVNRSPLVLEGSETQVVQNTNELLHFMSLTTTLHIGVHMCVLTESQ